MGRNTALRYMPVILCGGSGTRLWPLSRNGFPKQFLVFDGQDSLFQQSYQRLQSIQGPDFELQGTLVVTGEAHRFLVMEQLRELQALSNTSILLEPVSRNTAPAITLAALQAQSTGCDPVLVVSPADHIIQDTPAFTQTLRRAIRTASAGHLVVLGVTPTKPETGYGYIRHSQDAGIHGERNVVHFTEKPDAKTALSLMRSGEYSWNAGIFVVTASRWLNAIQTFAPDILDSVQSAWQLATQDGHFSRPDSGIFSTVRAESADYAVLEKCPGSPVSLRMIELNAQWSDLGAWDAVWQTGQQDDNGNVCVGDVLCLETRDTLVHAHHRLVSTIGVQDLVVVETADAVLVMHRDKAQNVKVLVEKLQQQKRDEHLLHRKVHRPWGWYDSIDESARFKVKRISVKPGASLSLQMHHHRAEHWVVVKGTAQVTCGDKTFLLSENQSTYIPLGQTHQLHNPGSIDLEIIEVQSGSYLGEDDIVRFADTYGRL